MIPRVNSTRTAKPNRLENDLALCAPNPAGGFRAPQRATYAAATANPHTQESPTMTNLAPSGISPRCTKVKTAALAAAATGWTRENHFIIAKPSPCPHPSWREEE